MKVYVQGNQGANEVLFHSGLSGVTTLVTTFIELLETGVALTTTYEHSTGRAVHSRHTILSEGLFPSQYYGTCKLSNVSACEADLGN